MLSVLHIENIAVIEQADIVFNQGFNVLTGETGAGKSIVIDAISAILGERAYRDMVRTGAAKASVRALFRQVPELPWFQENGVPYEEETLIQREIYLDGKNVCRVNGQLLSVSICSLSISTASGIPSSCLTRDITWPTWTPLQAMRRCLLTTKRSFRQWRPFAGRFSG